MSLLLRWNAFGLRGRIVGAVLITAVVTLLVAAVALLPRLEGSLRTASKNTLVKDIGHAKRELDSLASMHYGYIAELGARDRTHRLGIIEKNDLLGALTKLNTRLGATEVALIGYVDLSGHGRPVV